LFISFFRSSSSAVFVTTREEEAQGMKWVKKE